MFNTVVTPEARKLVNEVMDSGWLSEGKKVKEFEEKLSERGLSNPVCVNSGTSALHLALHLCGAGPGDEVILPAQTFIATGMAILMCGATPVFCDIGYNGNMSPLSLKNKITSKTKAVIPVHWGGLPCDLKEINAIADVHNISVIEDAAHAFGSTYLGKSIGSISRFTCFSFQAIKHVTTGDGGVLCCKNERDYKLAKTARWFGIDRDKSKESVLGERQFDVETIGFKYHMNDLSAAMGIGNLVGFDQRLQARQMNAQDYYGGISAPGFNLVYCPPDRTSSFWFANALVEDRDKFAVKMKRYGIPVSVVHQRIDKYSVFGGPYNLPTQQYFDEHQISLPTTGNIPRIIRMVNSGW